MGKPRTNAETGRRSSFARLADLFGLAGREDEDRKTAEADSAAPASRPPAEELGVGGVDWGRRSLYRDPYRH